MTNVKFCIESFRSVYVLILVFFLSYPVYSANFVTINKHIKVKHNISTLAKLPDLVIVRSIFNNSRHNDRFSGVVQIKNMGGTPINKRFYFSIQMLGKFNRWYKIPGACFAVNTNSTLKPKQTISKNFTFVYNPGGRNVKVRVYIDSACENETHYIWGDVKESNEGNNYSQIQTISGYSNPKLLNASPANAIIGKDIIYASGRDLAPTSDTYKFFLKNISEGRKYRVYVIRRSNTTITFKAPKSLNSGKYYVCVEYSCLTSKILHLYKESFCPWNIFIDKIEGFYHIFGEMHINTKKAGSRCSYENTSYEHVLDANLQLKKQPLNIRKIQFHLKGMGDYRYLISDLNADIKHISVIKYTAHQFVINIPFESRGVEAKGCFKSIVGGGWHDNLAPDIQINNLVVKVAILLISNNGKLDYKAATSVKANIKAARKINTKLLNLFVSSWRSKVEKGIKEGINDALNKNAKTKNGVLNSFLSILRIYGTRKIPDGTSIKNIKFKRDGIYLIY